LFPFSFFFLLRDVRPFFGRFLSVFTFLYASFIFFFFTSSPFGARVCWSLRFLSPSPLLSKRFHFTTHFPRASLGPSRSQSVPLSWVCFFCRSPFPLSPVRLVLPFFFLIQRPSLITIANTILPRPLFSPQSSFFFCFFF